jgi:hypothetical protein
MAAVAVAVFAGIATPVVLALPGLAALFRGDALAFNRVKSAFLQVDGGTAIVVEGELVNTSGRTAKVPAIRVSLRDGRADEVYAWVVEPAATELAAGAALGFRSAQALPDAGASEVAVSLADRAVPPAELR